MRAVACWVVVFLTAIGCSARSSGGSRGSSGSRSSSSRSSSGSYGSSSRSSGGSYGSSYSSSTSSRYTSTYVSRGTISRSAGLSNYNSFAAGAAVGYIVGSSYSRPYYYGYSGYRYTGSYDFGESVCKASVSKSDIESDNDTTIVTNSTDGLVVVYWECNSNENCCGLDCCPGSSFSVLACIIISIFVVLMVLICCCGAYSRYKKRRDGLVLGRQPVVVSYTQQGQIISGPRVAGSYPGAPPNPFTLPPLPPSTFHQQAPYAPFASSQQIPRSDPYQPTAFFPAPPNNPNGISTVSSPLPPVTPDHAQLYPKPRIDD